MRVNLIPMAGRGKRFKDEGYKLPKPVIPVDGVPMVIAAAKSLPVADKYIFICLSDHITKYKIDKTIKKYYPKAIIVPIKGVTGGQASTSLLAEPHVDPDDELTIGACDNGMDYKRASYDKLIKNKTTDALIWTFRNNPNVKRHPEHWGWVKVGKDGFVKKVSVKIPISKTPMNDHAVVGCFSFKKAKYFFENVEKMISADRRINGEFYNDECMNVLVENKLKVKPMEIDTYLGWGTPDDLRTYEYWSSYFKLAK
ncbi:MAG TPA: nucleotidyltransferase [Patescibacteria group bacterium]|nr:nucleotidyltransferase [Patescibacteria group bacterium]